MALPATVIYYVGYDYLNDDLKRVLPKGLSSFAPFCAGAASRVLAVTAISPIELFRTRIQSSAVPFTQVLQEVVEMTRSKGPFSLWKGLSATLWRDVPFSAVYWFGFETIKAALLPLFPQKDRVNKFLLPFISGASSGVVAAAITTPFDVAKTLTQINNEKTEGNVFRQLRNLWVVEGPSSVFRGLIPRIARVGPACAIMISSYEMGKFYFISNRISPN